MPGKRSGTGVILRSAMLPACAICDSGRVDRSGRDYVAPAEALTETATEATVRRVRRQAVACRELGSPLYAGLLDHAADDLLAGGPVAAVLDGNLDAPWRSALALRMLGGVHALVLTGQAPGLAAFYPSVGGTADPGPKQDHGFMYGRGFEDPDGHIWEVMWMDAEAAKVAMGKAKTS